MVCLCLFTHVAVVRFWIDSWWNGTAVQPEQEFQKLLWTNVSTCSFYSCCRLFPYLFLLFMLSVIPPLNKCKCWFHILVLSVISPGFLPPMKFVLPSSVRLETNHNRHSDCSATVMYCLCVSMPSIFRLSLTEKQTYMSNRHNNLSVCCAEVGKLGTNESSKHGLRTTERWSLAQFCPEVEPLATTFQSSVLANPSPNPMSCAEKNEVIRFSNNAAQAWKFISWRFMYCTKLTINVRNISIEISWEHSFPGSFTRMVSELKSCVALMSLTHIPCTHICMHMHAHTHQCTHVHTHTLMQVHTYEHTHTHTHTHTQKELRGLNVDTCMRIKVLLHILSSNPFVFCCCFRALDHKYYPFHAECWCIVMGWLLRWPYSSITSWWRALIALVYATSWTLTLRMFVVTAGSFQLLVPISFCSRIDQCLAEAFFQWIWSRARLRVLMQNKPTRELISTHKL